MSDDETLGRAWCELRGKRPRKSHYFFALWTWPIGAEDECHRLPRPLSLAVQHVRAEREGDAYAVIGSALREMKAVLEAGQ